LDMVASNSEDATVRRIKGPSVAGIRCYGKLSIKVD
jgi:hypothetical protein